MLKTVLVDGYGNGIKAKINKEGELSVVVHPHPPQDETKTTSPFRQYFTNDGLSTGSNDMVVNGSTTNQSFYIKAIPDYDIYINSINAEVSDGGSPTLNLFGALAALSNGVQWLHFTQESGEYTIHEGVKTNKEFIRLANGRGAFGDGVNAFLADVSGGGTAKSYFAFIDISEIFGMPWGLRLRKGTTDQLIFKIRDDLSALTTFNAIGYGIRQD